MLALLSTLFLVLTCSLCSVVWAETLKLEVVHSRLPRLRSSHSAVYDGEDSIYIIGGYNGTILQTDVLKYSLESDTIETVGILTSRMSGGAVMHGEDILYFGGRTSPTGSEITTITKFSTVTGNSTSGGTLPEGMYSMAIAWDSSTQLAYTFGGWYTARLNVFRYNPANNQTFPVATLQQARYQAAAVWTRNGLGYVFGGSVTGTVPTSDIFEFDPVHGTVTSLNVTLPYNITNACAVSTNERVYVLGGSGGGRVAYLDLLNHEVEAVDMDFWPQLLEVSACVYVPKLDRIYIIGGYGSYSGEADRHRDEIFYIQSGNRDPVPMDCSDGGLRVGPDPFCCTSYYVCNAGEPRKLDCINGMQFNPATLLCDDESVVKCKNNYYG